MQRGAGMRAKSQRCAGVALVCCLLVCLAGGEVDKGGRQRKKVVSGDELSLDGVATR